MKHTHIDIYNELCARLLFSFHSHCDLTSEPVPLIFSEGKDIACRRIRKRDKCKYGFLHEKCSYEDYEKSLSRGTDEKSESES